MSLKDTFCSSPWIHAKITHNGQFQYCRWQVEKNPRLELSSNIHKIEPIEFFRDTMSLVRQQMLNGDNINECQECYQSDQYNKISGRQRQLLKVGVTVSDFEKTLLSSPIRSELEYSQNNNGETNYMPIDWQVDLGNYCNGSCVYCTPEYSSSLASEFKKLGFIKEVPKKAWTEYPELVDKFINTLKQTKHLAYVHFLGGETLITPAFKKILQALIDNQLSTQISIGFTTNLTVWNQEIVDMLTHFKEVNLGMSVECFHPVNDYVRYPSLIEDVTTITKKWITIGKELGWLMQFRITPTNLTILHITSLYDFAYQNQIAVESCNFLNKPTYMRVTVLPLDQRKEALQKLKKWVYDHDQISEKIVNTRDPTYAQSQVVQDAKSYINYLENEPYETEKLPELVSYLKKLESSRNNSILNYLPEYENILRSAGY